MMPREVCGPTVHRQPSYFSTKRVIIPQSSTSRRDRCACCASRGTHRRHRDGFRTRRKRSCWTVSA
jgi:hypothetical protein